MTSKTRSFLADVVVGLVVFIVALWLFRRVIGLIFWLASVLALILVVGALLSFARWLRKG